MSLPSAGVQRRHYTDLIRKSYAKWINADPEIEIRVGSYGILHNDTGDFMEEGNVYDPYFQKELDKHGVKLRMSDYPPEEGPIESDVIVSSRYIKENELNLEEADVPGITGAPIKAQWTFEQGKTDAVLAMHRPRQIYLPPSVVLEHLYKVDKLIGKWLVTAVHVTDAYTFYLSDKSGDKFSLALLPKEPTSTSGDASGKFAWWADARSGLLHQRYDPTGNFLFMPVYSLRRPIKRIRRIFRDTTTPEPAGDDLWVNDYPPWELLDEDGEEDPVDPEEFTAVDPFWFVEQKHLATVFNR